MLSSTTDSLSSARPNSWVIALGWTGCALWSIELLSSYAKIELVDSADIQILFHVLQIGLGWLWPIALILNLRASTVWPPLRYLLMAGAAFLTVPAFCYSLMYLGLYWIGHQAIWQDEQILYRNITDTEVRIAAQSRDDGFATGYPQHRVVKLTPVLGLWQLAVPVDTSRFKEKGWQRVAQ